MKENKNIEKSEGKKLSPKLIIAAVAAVVVLVVAVALGTSYLGEMKTPAKSIEGYLTSMYADTLIRDMQEYLVEDIRQLAYDEFTFYGQSLLILQSMQQEKMQLVGDPFTISVKVDDEATASATALKAARTTYGATQLRDVSFTATFEGSVGTADFTGIVRVAQIDGKWYLTEYNLPLTAK